MESSILQIYAGKCLQDINFSGSWLIQLIIVISQSLGAHYILLSDQATVQCKYKAELKRGAIFDLDGTLFDTFEHHWEAWRHACQRHGVPLTREQFIWSFGRRNESIIPELWRQAGRPAPAADLVERVGEEKEASFRERLSGRVTPMPGAVELVTRLAAAGWRLAAGSSAPPANVEAFMQGLGSGLPFDALVTGADVREGKPHP